LAAAAYLSLVDVEKASGKSKYSSQATKSIIEIKYKLINSAFDSKVVEKVKKLYDAYLR
jgi:inhibitor of KinA sporulation pathway (predicted exonuclease)